MPPRQPPKDHPPKGRPRTKLARHRAAFWVLCRAYTIEQLLQWYKEGPPKKGRRPRKIDWLVAWPGPVQAKDRMPNADWQRNVRTNPPRRKARKKI